MTVIAPSATLPHMAFNNDCPWDKRSSDHFKPRSEANTLPSIRQIIPELPLIASSREGYVRPQSNGSPGSWSWSEYTTSSSANKRRKIKIEEEQESLGSRQIPLVFRTAKHEAPPSPRLRSRSATAEPWPPASKTPSLLNAGIPAPVEVKEAVMSRVTLPSLKITMKFEDQGPNYDFSYHHQSHYQSQPPSPVRSFDRPPFSAGVYPTHYQESGRFGDLGMSMGGEARQRRRRGNLPKETTEKLRTWFMNHLHHPYPTEDEKQELMRQTDLQMNQISNWFINARRRQLPALKNSMLAESNALTRGRGSIGRDGRLPTSAIGAGYDSSPRRDALPLSDGEGGSCDEDMDSLRRKVGSMKRGSV